MLELHHSGPGRYGFDLTPALARFDGRLFGGAGLAAAVAVLEAETDRRALWTTVQFVGSAEIGEHIQCRADVLAAGHNTSQAQVTATVDDRIVFVALGSTARERDDAFSAAIGTMPDVPGPDDCRAWLPELPIPGVTVTARGPLATAEFRVAEHADGTPSLWARLPSQPLTRPTISYLTDFVPSAVLVAAGRAGGGTSLDNSVRFGRAPEPDSEWILVETDPYVVEMGYVHGAARVWSIDGQLLGVASQTAIARVFD